MKLASLLAQVSFVLIVVLLSTSVLAQSDCFARVAEIDRRVETGNYPAENVQIVRQMQSMLRQMCPFMDETALAGMQESIDDLLPAGSEEEAGDPRVRSVLLAAPTGRSIAAEAVVRGEPMNQFWLWDWDVYEGRLRVLYSSFPNTEFFGRPDWRFNVYVTEMTPAGVITHRLITSKQANDHAALMLRRGFDEILFQRQVNRPGAPAALERWSISDTRKLTTVDITGRKLSMNGEAWVYRGLPMTTSDGNILYVARKMGTRLEDRPQIGWFKYSPGGAQLGSGTAAEIKDNFDIWSSFHTSNGGAGLIVNISPGGGNGTPTNDVAAAFGFMGSAAGGKRALIVDGKTNLTFTSTKLNGNRPATASAATTTEQTRNQVMLLAAQFGASRSVLSNNIGPHRLDAVKETGRGYAYLAEVNAGSNDTPPSNGLYLIEFDASGEINEIYLQPIVETLEFTVVNFAPSHDGRFYLYGYGETRGDSHVILIDRDGNPIARSRTTFDSATSIADIVADATGVWLLGDTGYGSDNNLWLERIEMGSE
ncbi:MAG: hypothetical protein GXP15_05535 [Gammaproteobacteria bacterium]|nr:hypothetical protein [Gammaproteobacteria bacterium]